MPGLLLAAIGAALFTTLTPDAAYVTHVLPSELLLGLGLGLAIVPCISTATQNAEPKDVGVTSAMTNTSQQIGASIGTALLNTIAAAATATYLATHVRSHGVVATATVHGYATASAWVAGIFVLAAMLAAVLINVDPGSRWRTHTPGARPNSSRARSMNLGPKEAVQAAAALLPRQFGGGIRFEPVVGNGLPAANREAVGPVFEALLGPADRGQPVLQLDLIESSVPSLVRGSAESNMSPSWSAAVRSSRPACSIWASRPSTRMRSVSSRSLAFA